MSSTQRKFIRKSHKSKQFCRKRKNGRLGGILVALMVVIFVSGSIYYLGLINNSATSGYIIDDLEKKSADLKNTNQKLEVEVIELEQIARIEATATKELAMVKSDQVDYLTDKEEEVAMR